MTARRQFVVGAVAVMIALASGIYIGIEARGGSEARDLSTTPTSEAIAKLFAAHLNDSEGKTLAMSQWQGRTLVINFWATWCPPCREEMPAFSRLQTKYAANGIQFVGIALDSADNVINYAKLYPVTYPLLVAGTQGAELTRQLGNSFLTVPYTVVLNANGEAQMTRMGRIYEQELDVLLQKITIVQ
jgi:thiol-disulfide isomerase/thioredoxin